MSPTFRALAHPNYRLYWSGGLVSNVGTWMQRVAQDWLVLLLTGGSGAALGVVTGLQFLPILLLSPYAGSVADRISKQRLLKVAQLGMAAPAAVLGMLALSGLVEAWHVYVLATVFGTATAFEAPARQAFVSELVAAPDVANAVGLNGLSFNAGRIIGPAIAGLAIALLGSGVEATGAVILANAASYGFVYLALRRMRNLPDAAQHDRRRRGMIIEGARYLRTRPDLMLILGVMGFVGTFGLNFQITSALMATEVYGKGASEFGLLGTTVAMGSIVGSLLAARREHPRLRLVLGTAVAFGVVEIVASTMPSYAAFMVMTPLIGVTAMTTITAANAFMQLTVPAELRGRVMAIYLMVFMGGTPVGAPLMGLIAEVWGARWSLAVGGGLSIVGAAGCLSWFTFRQRRREALEAPRLVRCTLA